MSLFVLRVQHIDEHCSSKFEFFFWKLTFAVVLFYWEIQFEDFDPMLWNRYCNKIQEGLANASVAQLMSTQVPNLKAELYWRTEVFGIVVVVQIYIFCHGTFIIRRDETQTSFQSLKIISVTNKFVCTFLRRIFDTRTFSSKKINNFETLHGLFWDDESHKIYDKSVTLFLSYKSMI